MKHCLRRDLSDEARLDGDLTIGFYCSIRMPDEAHRTDELFGADGFGRTTY